MSISLPRQPIDTRYLAARLPRWVLPTGWPVTAEGAPGLADIAVASGRIADISPHIPASPPGADTADAAAPVETLDLHGAPVLPGLVEAHTHLDKAFTIQRLGRVAPGLLGAIEAMHVDRLGWTAEDVRHRAGQALEWAWQAGVCHLRTHVDWWEPSAPPIAWSVIRELAGEWADRLAVEQVSLMPLSMFAGKDEARSLARRVAGAGPGARLGGFVHTSLWDQAALAHLLEAADAEGLDVDLHVDEELDPAACGLATAARLMREMRFGGRLVASHACALSVQSPSEAAATLDAVAGVGITLVALPITNLLLQDARPGRTPRLRGLTLVQEAQARGIPVLIGSDNVQDSFCRVGSFDPLEAYACGVLVASSTSPSTAGRRPSAGPMC